MSSSSGGGGGSGGGAATTTTPTAPTTETPESPGEEGGDEGTPQQAPPTEGQAPITKDEGRNWIFWFAIMFIVIAGLGIGVYFLVRARNRF